MRKTPVYTLILSNNASIFHAVGRFPGFYGPALEGFALEQIDPTFILARHVATGAEQKGGQDQCINRCFSHFKGIRFQLKVVIFLKQ
jgi:hypothetical protein